MTKPCISQKWNVQKSIKICIAVNTRLQLVQATSLSREDNFANWLFQNQNYKITIKKHPRLWNIFCCWDDKTLYFPKMKTVQESIKICIAVNTRLQFVQATSFSKENKFANTDAEFCHYKIIRDGEKSPKFHIQCFVISMI